MTIILPELPVPELNDTAEKYLNWIAPLVDQSTYNETKALVLTFIDGEGKALQKDLQQFSKAQYNQGKSWLSDAWLDNYLSVRDTLPLSTNWTFRLALDLPDSGLKRLAYLIVGLGIQSAEYFNGQIAPNYSPRGEPLDMGQWLVLRGIGRIPQKSIDRYELAPIKKQQRFVVVWWQGQAFMLPILDKQHRCYSVDSIYQMLQQITQSSANNQQIAALSLAPAETAAALMEDLSQSPENQLNFQALSHSLFHLHLSPKAFADDATALQELNFLANEQLWAYKPMTICANVENNAYYVHLEHGSYDAGALQAIFARAEKSAQALVNTENNINQILAPQPLTWVLSSSQQAVLSDLKKQHHTLAKAYQVSITTLAFDTTHLPQRTSLDAIMQLLMQYAQLKTFGKIQNTYEAVDVSHFQAGRTECVRPVSQESVQFIQTLLAQKADLADFDAAHQEHKNRIKACKAGQGVNRHLLGLQLMANKRGVTPALFTGKAYAMLTGDFLSTSTLGNRHIIGDFAFTPTLSGGLGISYFLNEEPKGFLYCFSYHKDQANDIEIFIAAFKEGSKRLEALFKSHSNTL